MQALKCFWRCESGATATEYALIAAGIAVVLTGALKHIGKDLTSTFKLVRKALK